MGWTNSVHARLQRHRKAVALARACRLHGLNSADAAALDEKSRRAFERRAEVRKSSDVTWAAAVMLLRTRPGRTEATRVPGCDCTPNEHGALVDHLGWSCAHIGGTVAELRGQS